MEEKGKAGVRSRIRPLLAMRERRNLLDEGEEFVAPASDKPASILDVASLPTIREEGSGVNEPSSLIVEEDGDFCLENMLEEGVVNLCGAGSFYYGSHLTVEEESDFEWPTSE